MRKYANKENQKENDNLYSLNLTEISLFMRKTKKVLIYAPQIMSIDEHVDVALLLSKVPLPKTYYRTDPRLVKLLFK